MDAIKKYLLAVQKIAIQARTRYVYDPVNHIRKTYVDGKLTEIVHTRCNNISVL